MDAIAVLNAKARSDAWPRNTRRSGRRWAPKGRVPIQDIEIPVEHPGETVGGASGAHGSDHDEERRCRELFHDGVGARIGTSVVAFVATQIEHRAPRCPSLSKHAQRYVPPRSRTVARPGPAIDSTPLSPLLQLASFVTSRLEPSVRWAIALN